MNKSQFKSAFAAYRRYSKSAPPQDWYAQEWAASIGWKPLTSNDVLLARYLGFHFAKPKNRFGQYGWAQAHYKLA